MTDDKQADRQAVQYGDHFASLLLRGGADIKRVQEWPGHHSAAFTLDIYSSCPTITRRRCGRSRRYSRRPSARHRTAQ
jgi:integrase